MREKRKTKLDVIDAETISPRNDDESKIPKSAHYNEQANDSDASPPIKILKNHKIMNSSNKNNN